jgi:Antidote-toxin recognition MazE, bacterial antitoxin
MDASGSKVGRRGTVVLPGKLRRRLGIEQRSFVVAEERADGIVIRPGDRPATVLPVEFYTAERRAEFILNDTIEAMPGRRSNIARKKLALPAFIEQLYSKRFGKD